jgi:hypothetical protein
VDELEDELELEGELELDDVNELEDELEPEGELELDDVDELEDELELEGELELDDVDVGEGDAEVVVYEVGVSLDAGGQARAVKVCIGFRMNGSVGRPDMAHVACFSSGERRAPP